MRINNFIAKKIHDVKRGGGGWFGGWGLEEGGDPTLRNVNFSNNSLNMPLKSCMILTDLARHF